MPGFEPEWKKKYNDMNFDKAEDAKEPIPVEEYEDEEYVEEKKEAAVSDKIAAYEMKTIALADEESYVEEVVEVVMDDSPALDCGFVQWSALVFALAIVAMCAIVLPYVLDIEYIEQLRHWETVSE